MLRPARCPALRVADPSAYRILATSFGVGRAETVATEAVGVLTRTRPARPRTYSQFRLCSVFGRGPRYILRVAGRSRGSWSPCGRSGSTLVRLSLLGADDLPSNTRQATPTDLEARP